MPNSDPRSGPPGDPLERACLRPAGGVDRR
jgi:hypothetical protein